MRRLLLPGLLALGCGYRMTSGGAALPEGIQRVCVPVFRNQTAEPALETVFTQALREQVQRAGKLTEGDCEARIEGDIQGVSGGLSVYEIQRGRVASYRAYASVLLTLKRQGRTVSTFAVNGSEDFLPGGDVLEAERNRQAALRRLTVTLMRQGYDGLATGW